MTVATFRKSFNASCSVKIVIITTNLNVEHKDFCSAFMEEGGGGYEEIEADLGNGVITYIMLKKKRR